MDDKGDVLVFFDLVYIKEEGNETNIEECKKVAQDSSLPDLCKAVAKIPKWPDYVISDMKVYLNQIQFKNGVECPSSFTVQDLQSAGYGSLENRIVITVPDRNLQVGDATFSKLEGPISEFEDYQRVAQLMLNSDIVKNVEQKVYDLYNERIELPFIFIEGSSGCGKSQLAMTLYYKSLMQISARKVYYLNCVTQRLSTQHIYRYFESPSALFMKCIDSDFNAQVSPSESRNQLLENKLHVFDFIRQLLFDDIYGKQAEVKVKKFEGTELASLVRSKFDASNRPVVILDEYLPRAESEDSINEKLLNFIRNCFLTVGIMVITMGTDVQVANVSSRPLFALDAYNLLQKVQDIDKVFSELFQRFRDYKELGNELCIAGQRAQVALALNACHTASNYDDSAYLINYHYGRLLLDYEPTVVSTDGLIVDSKVYSPWCPKSAFPSPEDDLLLHLVMLGGLGYKAIYRGSSVCPLRVCLKEMLQDEKVRSSLSLSQLKKASHTVSDDQWLDALMASAICLASRQGGVKGIGLKEFFKHLMYELHPEAITFENLSLDSLNLIEEFAHVVVPFYSAPGAKWPDFILNSKEFNCRNLEYVAGNVIVDSHGISNKNVYRIYQSSDVSIVVGAISQTESFDCFIKGLNFDLSSCKFVKLSQKEDAASFEDFSDQVYKKGQGGKDGGKISKQLVVVIEIGQFP
ncbi:hypothetical protein MP228_006621 [Amoeboaphelidium protococcarum]|nr:hypothetical protein MP228_006621 [Amoeboaphelidium protococcarum]